MPNRSLATKHDCGSPETLVNTGDKNVSNVDRSRLSGTDGHGSVNCDFSDIDQCGYVDVSHTSGQKWTRHYDRHTSGRQSEFLAIRNLQIT